MRIRGRKEGRRRNTRRRGRFSEGSRRRSPRWMLRNSNPWWWFRCWRCFQCWRWFRFGWCRWCWRPWRCFVSRHHDGEAMLRNKRICEADGDAKKLNTCMAAVYTCHEEVRRDRCPVLGARCSVPGARCSVLGARCPLLGARCPVLGDRVVRRSPYSCFSFGALLFMLHEKQSAHA